MSETTVINKEVLSGLIADKCNLNKKDAKIFIDTFTEVVKEELAKNNKIQLVNFGTFEVKERAGREGRNPMTGEPIQIKASKFAHFKPGKAMKDALNE